MNKRVSGNDKRLPYNRLCNHIGRENSFHRRLDWVGDGRPRRHNGGKIGEGVPVGVRCIFYIA
jgi:hypothetical protein